jgi:hypothetical protein
MNGDISLYEVRVTDPSERYLQHGRTRPNGKATTCVHRLFVAAFSRQSAASLARCHCFQKLGQHVDDVSVFEVEGKVFDMGMFSFKTKHMVYFKMECEAQARKEALEEKC